MRDLLQLLARIEGDIEDWQDEADTALGRDPHTKDQLTQRDDEIAARHRADAMDYLKQLDRLTIDNGDGYSQNEKEQKAEPVRRELHGYL